MNIFYTDEAGNVVGPIDRDALQDLIDADRLSATTQVCREGSEQWRLIPELNVYYTDQSGGVLGPVTRAHLKELVDADELPVTTQVCHEGSERWQPISACFRRSTKEEVDPVPAVPGTHSSWRGDPATEKQVNYLRKLGYDIKPELTKEDAGEMIAAIPRGEREVILRASWRDDPATEKQLNYLRTLGCEIRGGLTKGEATEMIDAIPEDERGVKQIEAAEKERNLYCAWVLHRDVLSAKRELGDAEKADVDDARECLRVALNVRVRFWQDVFNDGMEWADESISDQLVEFADQFRDIFTKPSRKAVQEILDSLDAKSVDWDREMPEMFFDVLGWK